MTILTAQHELESLYNNTGFDYGSQYLGFMTHFDKGADEQSQSLKLLSSRDAESWMRPNFNGESLIPTGGTDSWDRFQIILTGTAPIRVGDLLYIYYRGTSRRHNKVAKEYNADTDRDQDKYSGADSGEPWMGMHGMAIGLATLRLDGVASVCASYDSGALTTVAFSVARSAAGSELRLNAKADYGSITVELLATESDESSAVQADGTDLAVGWGAQTALPDGVAFRLRFELRNARLFSYRALAS